MCNESSLTQMILNTRVFSCGGVGMVALGKALSSARTLCVLIVPNKPNRFLDPLTITITYIIKK